ncbi:MAG: type IV toxin-antitoxin system AbiEi family antitoxin domain-containing protein [Propionibacteriaceae bacterium]
MTSRDVLWEEAVDHHGYVTLAGATSLGLTRPAIDMLLARGRLQRAASGVYRVPQVPATRTDPYMLAVLWTGANEACLSHDTALDAYEVCDINPDRIHVTVRPGRRIRRARGEGYVLHHETLSPDQIGWWQRIPTVTLPTAIEQCIRSGVPTYLLRQAITRAAEQGALRPEVRASLETNLETRDDP